MFLQATGKTATEYVSEETTMTAYANLHLLLEQMRVRAHRSKRGAAPNPDDEASHYGVEPPRVLVVGPESSGKTTACKILTNYAVRGPTPAYPLIVNLDPGDVWSLGYPVALHSCALRRGALQFLEQYLHVQSTRLFRPPHQLIHWESPQPLHQQPCPPRN